MQITDSIEIGPLLGAAIGATAALLAVSVTSLFNLWLAKLNINAQSRQKAKELKVQKLEELFFLFTKWHIHLSTIYLYHLRAYRGLLPYEQVLDLVKDQSLLAPGEAQKYRMVMAIHFPPLEAAYAQVEAARKQLTPFLSDPSKSKLTFQEFDSCLAAFDKACATFKQDVSSTAEAMLSR